jgi:WD40 repeat protein
VLTALSVRGRRRHALLLLAAGSLAACGGTSPTHEPSIASREASPSISQTAGPAPSPPAGLPGGWLMFSRFDESTHSLISAHLIRPDGTGEVELTLPLSEPPFSFSRDGTRIAVATSLKDGRIATAILRLDGTIERVLEIPDPTLNLACTVWSPDDERLACDGFNDDDPSQNGVYTVRGADGGDLVRVTTAEGMNDYIVGDYSPDGRQLIFRRTTDEADAPLMLVDATGGEPRALGETAYEDSGRFSPDGDTVLTSAGGRLVFLDLDGNVVSSIEDSGGYLFGAVWSPDGEWIAYSRTTPGVFMADVFISRADGSELWRVTNTSANEIAVEWGSGSD